MDEGRDIMEFFRRIQKHGSGKCIILRKYERQLLSLGDVIKVTMLGNKLIIEAATPEEEANYGSKS